MAASLRELRQRRASVQATKKITRAPPGRFRTRVS
jgi:hypothetical protein